MSSDLSGRHAVAISSNYGVEQDELVVPVTRLRQLGAEVDIFASSADMIQTLMSDKHLGREVAPNGVIAGTDAASYDVLIIPGGTVNADNLRLDDHAVGLVKQFGQTSRPIAAICHGPWLLVEAGMLTDRIATSYPSLRTDIENAGGAWADKAVVVDADGSPTIITSRNPGDLSEFTDAVTAELTMA